MKFLHFIILFVFNIFRSNGRSYSVDPSACLTFLPEHGEIEPQSDVAKIQIIPHKIKINRGRELKVSLQTTSQNVTFRGFMIQSRDVFTNNIVGNFVSRTHNVISCQGNQVGDTAVHRDPSDKITETFLWRAPMHYSGFVRFL